MCGVPQADVTRRLLRTRDYIDAHFARELSVREIAAIAHQSPAHFARQFHAAFGETPYHYLLSRRLERAAMLLRNTDYSVTRVANIVGWASVGSFSATFARVYGLSPTTYRAEHLPALIQRVIPLCVLQQVERPRLRRIEEDTPASVG